MTQKVYQKAIEAYRSDKDLSLLVDYACKHNGKSGYGESDDENYWNRKNLIFELYQNYTREDKPLIKWLLTEELKGFAFDIPVYTADVCAFMLYKYMENEDVYDLAHAKFGGGTDLQMQIDIELLFGYDKEDMKLFLKNDAKRAEESNQILEIIERYESNPKAVFKSRETYIEFFEQKKIKRIVSELMDIEQL